MRYLPLIIFALLITGCSMTIEDPEQSNERVALAHSRESEARENRLAEEARADRIRLEALHADASATKARAWSSALPVILFVLFAGLIGCLISVCHIVDAGTRRQVAQITMQQRVNRIEYREVQPTDNEIIVYEEF